MKQIAVASQPPAGVLAGKLIPHKTQVRNLMMPHRSKKL